MLFLSRCQLCSKCFYTLPRAIKEKKKKEEGVGHSGVQRGKERLVFLSFFFWNWKKNGSGQRKVGRERVGRKYEREEKKVFVASWLIVGLCKKGGVLFRQLEVKKKIELESFLV